MTVQRALQGVPKAGPQIRRSRQGTGNPLMFDPRARERRLVMAGSRVPQRTGSGTGFHFSLGYLYLSSHNPLHPVSTPRMDSARLLVGGWEADGATLMGRRCRTGDNSTANS